MQVQDMQQAQQAALALLLAEMQGLMGILPARGLGAERPAEARRAAQVDTDLDEMIEDGFDNMPV
ncbi:hypothetical protein [Gemmobacter caeruleus]|uniref:hypothetical protein n=1 Tax=Gemmobacter caeruleus TaxID=2595004 RepID=UPI0011EE37C8|nr:hypothetical protein [Gemmobacter caeruleus]